ncbi:hypothetical protein LJR010_004426 [Ensifer adhaerens]|uniref:hypothetical protein n=1 Tax=Ensifer adhaerens TaxID=106592 RepID=UPI00399B4A60
MQSRRSFLSFAGAGLVAMGCKGALASSAFREDAGNPERRLWHVEAFGSGQSKVGSGGDDTVALQSALDSGEMIDVTGALLRISDTINVNYPGANVSSVMASRVGNRASSKIRVSENSMPRLFNVSAANFEASGFFVECDAGNAVTTLFHFERPAGAAADIDAVISRVGTEGGGKIFHIYGRGLKLDGCTFANTKIAVGDLDFPVSWTPNGSSNDTQETAMRAYQFDNLRFHGVAAGVRNVGRNSLNCGGIQMTNIHGDIGIGGGGAFVGVARDGQFANILSRMGATNGGGIVDLHDGSSNCAFTNLGNGGFKGADVARLVRNPIVIRSGPIGVNELSFIGGTIGPCNRNGVHILGHGKAQNIAFLGIAFDRTNIEGNQYFPIKVEESGGAFTEVSIKLGACNFKFRGETPAACILGGLNSAVVTLYRDNLTTKPKGIPWTQSNIVVG